MSIPIKAQVRLNTFEWRSVFMLCDGSVYGTDRQDKVHEFSRSYVGHVVKDFCKAELRLCHEERRTANLTEQQGDLVDADKLRSDADLRYRLNYLPAVKFWTAFKKATKAVPRNVPDSRNRHKVRDKDGKFTPVRTSRPYRTE